MSSKNSSNASMHTAKNKDIWVRETKFGRWFLSTHTWYRYVLSQAVVDFKRLLNTRIPKAARILDAGCGQGLAFGLLEAHFKPAQIVGIDIDKQQITKAARAAKELATPTQALHANAGLQTFEAEYFDVVFCHQLLHHTAQQTETLTEFYRILKPGGILLVGESCVSFIKSMPVRLLFRHPAMAQQDAPGYIELVRNAGFCVNPEDIHTSRPWWSRRTLGLAQKWGINTKENPPTEILIVATKPENTQVKI